LESEAHFPFISLSGIWPESPPVRSWKETRREANIVLLRIRVPETTLSS
jgi:hypothetical protein